MCGMTTSFSWMIRGSIINALVVQPVGVVFFILTVGTFVISGVELVRPRQIWFKIWLRLVAVEFRIVSTFTFLLALGWAYKIWMMWNYRL